MTRGREVGGRTRTRVRQYNEGGREGGQGKDDAKGISPLPLLDHFRLLDDEPPFLVPLGLLEGLLVLPSEDGGAA